MARRDPLQSACISEAPLADVALSDRPSAASTFDFEQTIDAMLAAMGISIRVKKGVQIFRKGERASFIYAITDGAVKRYRVLPNDLERITTFRFTGDFLGLADLNRHCDTSEAITNSTLIKIPRGAFNDLIARRPNLAAQLLAAGCDDLREAERHIAILGRGDAIGKVALFIEMLSDMQRRRGRLSTQIHLPMSRSDIADYAGLSAEALSRAFTELGRRAILTAQRKRHLSITDPRRLRTLIEG